MGVVGAATPAHATATPLPVALVNQSSGEITGGSGYLTLENATHTVTQFPASNGDHVTVSYFGVKDNTDAFVTSGTGLSATFCGNFTAGAVSPAVDTPLVAADIASLAGIQAHCANPSAPIGTNGGTTVTVTGSGDVTIEMDLNGLPAGTQCVSNNTVIPCLLVVATLTQSVALALPIVNITATSVVGPALAYASLLCNPSAVPSTACASGRLSNPGIGVINPIVYGGIGFIPSDNNFSPTNPASYSAASTSTFGIGGANVTSVTQKVCADSLGATCYTSSAPALYSLTTSGGGAIPDATLGSPLPVGVTATGQLGGAIFIPTAASTGTGDKFLQTTAQHYMVVDGVTGTGVPCATYGATDISAGFIAVISGYSKDVKICSYTQIQYAQIRILSAAGIALAPNVDNLPGVVGTLSGHDFDPRTDVTIQLKTDAGNSGTAIVVTTDGVGAFTNVFAAGALDFPVTKIAVSGTAAGAATALTDITLAQKVDQCSGDDECNAGEIITAAIEPGTIQMFTQDAVVEIPALALTDIDVSDDTTWYPVSDPGAITQVIIGDMRGQNAGFLITGASTALVGSIPANTIPAMDVYWSDADCQAYADAGDNNDPLGVITSGADSVPDSVDGSALQDGSAELCTVAADATGRAAGMFSLDLNLYIAGRPITAADDYTGLLTLTIVGG